MHQAFYDLFDFLLQEILDPLKQTAPGKHRNTLTVPMLNLSEHSWTVHAYTP